MGCISVSVRITSSKKRMVNVRFLRQAVGAIVVVAATARIEFTEVADFGN